MSHDVSYGSMAATTYSNTGSMVKLRNSAINQHCTVHCAISRSCYSNSFDWNLVFCQYEHVSCYTGFVGVTTVWISKHSVRARLLSLVSAYSNICIHTCIFEYPARIYI